MNKIIETRFGVKEVYEKGGGCVKENWRASLTLAEDILPPLPFRIPHRMAPGLFAPGLRSMRFLPLSGALWEGVFGAKRESICKHRQVYGKSM